MGILCSLPLTEKCPDTCMPFSHTHLHRELSQAGKLKVPVVHTGPSVQSLLDSQSHHPTLCLRSSSQVIVSVRGLPFSPLWFLPSLTNQLALPSSGLSPHPFLTSPHLFSVSLCLPLQAATQFKASLAKLMEILMSKEPSYVRCIKPNDSKQAGMKSSLVFKCLLKYKAKTDLSYI